MFQAGLFNGKKILVTGGGTGLGRGMAERLLGLGAEIAICGRRKSVCDAAAEAMMKAYGGVVKGYGVDIRDASAVEAIVEEIFREGALTSLVNNAAGNFIARTEDLSPRGFDAIANIVMHGTFYVTQAVGKRWIAGGKRGSVVSIVVTWVRNGGPFVVPSAMSKAAVQAMTMSLAAEWGRYGIRLNAIAPGEIPTEGMSKRLSPGGEFEQGDGGRQPVRPRRANGGAAESGSLPALRRLRVADRRNHRHGRRAGARDGRQFLRIAQMGRRGMEGGARGDRGAERARPGSAGLRRKGSTIASRSDPNSFATRERNSLTFSFAIGRSARNGSPGDPVQPGDQVGVTSSRFVGTPKCPALIDVRPDDDFSADPRIVPGSIRRSPDTSGEWVSEFRGRSAVVICHKGLGLSHGVAALLRESGASAEALEGGLAAWAQGGLSLVPEGKLPPRNRQGRTAWVTRERPKIDRIACPWLIRRFVDPGALFARSLAEVDPGQKLQKPSRRRRAAWHQHRDVEMAQPPRRPARELDEYAFSELLGRRQPVGTLSERRAADGKANVFEVVVSQRRGLETCRAVEARDLAESMHRYDRSDACKLSVAVGIPDGARQSLGMQVRVGAVNADEGLPARQQLVFGNLRVFGLVGSRCARRD